MTGKRLQCDECGLLFPERPVKGWYWDVRKEAAELGWRVGGWDQRDRDVCPAHAEES